MLKTSPPLYILIFRRMLFAVAVFGAFPVSAQEGDITLPVQRLGASTVFDNIQRQTSYRVAVNNTRTDDLSVNITHATVPVKVVLDRLLDGSGMTYRVDGRFIVITAISTNSASGTTIRVAHTLRGKVTDDGVPLEGVTVRLMDAEQRKAITGRDGRFSIGSVLPGHQIVRLSTADDGKVRFRDIDVPAGGDSDVTLDMGGLLLDDADAMQAPVPNLTGNGPKMTTFFFSDGAPVAAPKTEKEYSLISSARMKSGDYLPRAAIKTNLVYMATTTLNISTEFGLAPRWTLDLTLGVNPWENLNGKKGGIRHVLFQPEARYWFSSRFENHFIGMHALLGYYRTGNIDFPLIKDLTGVLYKGWAYGAGFSYGYHLPMGRRWAWEFTLGVGYLYLDRKKYHVGEQEVFAGTASRHYLGPTKAGVSLIFMIR